MVEKDILIVINRAKFIVYDFRTSLEPKGYVNLVYQARWPLIELIFQERGVLYQSLTEILDGNYPRIIFNISSPAITSFIKIS